MEQPLSGEAADTLAIVRCVECGGLYEQGDEFWSLRFADLGEVAIYCRECAEREFGDQSSGP
jgi:hypothetical protein